MRDLTTSESTTLAARKAGYDREIMPKGFGHGLGTSLFERPDVHVEMSDRSNDLSGAPQAG